MKAYSETHQQGTISVENLPDGLKAASFMKGDFGVQISDDGRVWICVDGIAFIRFSPHPNGKMARE